MLLQQRLLTLVNDRLVSDVVLRRQTQLRCLIPPGVVNAEGLNRIRFLHPDGVAPSAVADVNDDRQLSLAFSNLTLQATGGAAPGLGGWLKP